MARYEVVTKVASDRRPSGEWSGDAIYSNDDYGKVVEWLELARRDDDAIMEPPAHDDVRGIADTLDGSVEEWRRYAPATADAADHGWEYLGWRPMTEAERSSWADRRDPLAFHLRVSLGNDAMRSGDDVADLLKRLSIDLRDRTLATGDDGSCRDVNGNTVGQWRVS